MRIPRSTFLDGGVVLAAATAYLYCAGAAEHGGYLGVLNLDPNVLDRNFHQILYQGFIVSFLPTMAASAVIVVTSFAYSFLILPWWIDWFRRSFRRKRNLVNVVRASQFHRKPLAVEVRARKWTMFWFKIALFIIVLLSLLARYEANGRERATSLLNAVRAAELSEESYVQVKLGTKDAHLVALACGARNCAGVDPQNWRVIYYPQKVASYDMSARELERKNDN